QLHRLERLRCGLGHDLYRDPECGAVGHGPIRRTAAPQIASTGAHGAMMTSNGARLTVLVVAALFFSSVLPDPALAQIVSFVDARKDFAAGTFPISVAVGDFNGDGIKDLAVANGGSNDVSVLLGTGDGTFQAPQS